MNTNERQQLFQLGNPGYDRKRKARQRAIAKRVKHQFVQSLLAQTATENAAAETAQPTPAPVISPILPAVKDVQSRAA